MQVALKDGTTIEIEASSAESAFDAQGAIDDAKVALEEVVDTGAMFLTETIQGFKSKLSKVGPTEIEVTIGVSVGKKGSIVIASASAEAQISVKAKWKLPGD